MTGCRADVSGAGRNRGRVIVALFASAVVLAIASLALGPTGISLRDLPRALASLWHPTDDIATLRLQLVLLDVRLPRTLLAVLVGAGLAVSGAVMQGLFRNPLADPGLVGVSAGAALAAVSVIALGNIWAAGWTRLMGPYALPVAAFSGGLVTTFLLTAVATRQGQLAIGTLLLAGIAFGAIAGALTGLISYGSDDRELRDVTLWMLGSLGGASWAKVIGVLPFFLLIALALPRLVRALNGLLLGEAEAFHLGIDVEAAKRIAIIVTAGAVGAAVAAAGMIGFVGVVVPHLVRLVAGSDHAVVLPASALLGGSLLLAADILARTLVAPAELPIGIVTALLGAPVFLHLVLRRSFS